MIPDWAEKYVGLPFRFHGRTLEGVDCFGLVYLIYKNEFGLEVTDWKRKEQEEPHITNMRIAESFKEGMQYSEWSPVTQPMCADVVLFNINQRPSHCGIMLDRTHFLHAAEGTNSVIQSLDRIMWKKRLAAFYRHERIC